MNKLCETFKKTHNFVLTVMVYQVGDIASLGTFQRKFTDQVDP